MNSDCPKIKKLFSQYIDRVLDYNATAQVETHLSSCQDCRNELHKLLKDETPKKAPAARIIVLLCLIFVFVFAISKTLNQTVSNKKLSLTNQEPADNYGEAEISIKIEEKQLIVRPKPVSGVVLVVDEEILDVVDQQTSGLSDVIDIHAVSSEQTLKDILAYLDSQKIKIVSVDQENQPYMIIILVSKEKISNIVYGINSLGSLEIPSYTLTHDLKDSHSVLILRIRQN